MAFLEELGKTLADTGKEVAAKTKNLTEAVSLRAQISAEKSKLGGAYAAVGRKYLELHPEGVEEALEREYAVVRMEIDKIAALEEKLCRTEGARICAECGAKVPKDSLYCGKCGAAMEGPAGEETQSGESEDTAPACGTDWQETAEAESGKEAGGSETVVEAEDFEAPEPEAESDDSEME